MDREPKHIEERIQWLTEQIQRVHDQLSMHEWIKAYEPWNKGEEWNIECFCGMRRAATKEEFASAEQKYDGY